MVYAFMERGCVLVRLCVQLNVLILIFLLFEFKFLNTIFDTVENILGANKFFCLTFFFIVLKDDFRALTLS